MCTLAFRFHFVFVFPALREIDEIHDEETWAILNVVRKTRYVPLGSMSLAPRRAMTGSPTKVPGDGSAAGSSEREHAKERPRNSDRTSKRRTRSSSGSSRAAASTKTIEPGERSKEREEGRKKARARDKTKGNVRSVAPDSGSAPVPDDRGGTRSKGRHRRTSDSHSSGPPRRSSVRKPSKGDAIVSSDVVETHPTVDRASATSTARASPPSSEHGPAQRKRRRSSNSVTTDDEDDDGKKEEDEKFGCVDDEKRSNLVADSLVPSQAFPAEFAANKRRETLLEDEQPLAPVSEPGSEQHQERTEVETCDAQSNNSALGKERSCTGGGGEERSTSSHGKAHLGRTTGGRRRREEYALKEENHGTGNDVYGTQEGPPGFNRTRSTTEGWPRRNRTTDHESLSTGLGVKVIDGGATKQLVITVGDALAERGKSGSSSDRSRGANAYSKPRSGNSRRNSPAQHVDIPLQQRERNHRRRRRPFPLDPEEEERSAAFRDNFATAVLAKDEETVNQPRSTERSEDLGDEATPPAEYSQIPPAGSSEVTKDQLGQANHRHVEHPLAFSEIDKALPCTTSPSESPRMAPSFSIVQGTAGTKNISNHQSLSHGPLSSANKLPNTAMPGGNQGGDPPSPAPSTFSSSSSSSVLGRAIDDRTAKYVTRQASFHDDVPGSYVDLNSPRGEEGGEKNEMGATVSIPPTNKTDSDPASSSARQPADTVRGTTRNDRDHRKGVIISGAAERTRTSLNPEAGGRIDLLASLPTGSADEQAGCLRKQGESVLVDPSKQQGSGQRGTQERFPESSFEGDDELARGLVHFRTDLSRRLACGDRPELFFLRPNESLAITRIEGSGRLLVTVREEAGAAALVAVDGAIVYDSAAHFGHATVQVRSPFVPVKCIGA